MSGREAARRDFSIARILATLCCLFVLFKVAVLFDWQQILFHRGCSFSLKLILEAVLIAGERKAAKDGKFCSSLPCIPVT